jgi:hypothetical protein
MLDAHTLSAHRPQILFGLVSIGVAIALGWSYRWFRSAPLLRPPRWERAYRAAMALCACAGVWAFTLFGQFHDHGQFGHQNFHAHDCYHYYFGSKYLREWGYSNMYLATVAALEEIGQDEPRKAIEFERIRDLRGSARFLYRREFLPLEAEARAHFSPQRWASLKRDLSFLRTKTPDNNWWHGVMLDNGFNPPPSYAVVSSVVANTVPFNETTWKWLGALDFLLLGIGVGVISYCVGPVPGLFTLVVLGNAPITTYNWTGGSFLRQLWVFFLMLGLAALARRKWARAGVALGASTSAVLFPCFFLFGALVPLGFRFYRDRRDRSFWRAAIGGAATIAVLLLLSVVVFGPHAWSEWRTRIGAHEVTFFDNHIGFKKIVTFAPEVGGQAFNAGDTVYPDWNRALLARAARGHFTDQVLQVLLSLCIVAGALRARPAEAALIVGSGLLVLWAMPAGYYTVYIGVFAAFILANRHSKWARARFVVVAAALLSALGMLRYEHDLITQMFLISVGWLLCILILSGLSWFERPAIPQTVEQRKRWIAGTSIAAALLFLAGDVPRNLLHDPSFLPDAVLRGGHVADMLDVGRKEDEQKHNMDIGEDFRVSRTRIDIYGYRISDGCGILRSGRTLKYDLPPAPHGGRLIVRSDAFYKGDLLTSVNGRVLPSAALEPHQTQFVYLQVPLPEDLGDAQLHVEQTTSAKDVGVFTVWLVQD